MKVPEVYRIGERNPLTMPRSELWRVGVGLSHECSCDPAAHHRENCSVTPIYAELCAELGNPWRVICQIVQDVWWSRPHTVPSTSDGWQFHGY